MLRLHAGFILAGMLLAGTYAAADDKDALSELKQDDLRAKFKKRMADKKAEVDATLKIEGYDYTATAEGIEYKFDKGPKLIWRYKADKPASEPIKTKMKEKLGVVITLVLGNDTTFVPKDVMRLQAALEVMPYNSGPTITSPVKSKSVERGIAEKIQVTINDAQTPPERLKLSAKSSNPGQLPESGLILSGTGPDRVLTVTVPTGKTEAASVDVTLTVTDEEGATAVLVITLQIAGVKPPPPMGEVMPPEPFGMPVGTYFPYMNGFPGRTGYGFAPPVGSGYPPGASMVPYWPQYWPLTAYPIYPAYWPSVQYMPTYSPQSYYQHAPTANLAAARPAQTSSDRIVPREELVKGLKEQDWVALYDAGYRHYWAGNFAQARECCAASIELKEDPRAWYYLALALDALGETDAATTAARYAAGLVLCEPRTAAATNEALKRVQGRLRDRLEQIQTETAAEGQLKAQLQARPKLLTMTPVGIASRP